MKYHREGTKFQYGYPLHLYIPLCFATGKEMESTKTHQNGRLAVARKQGPPGPLHQILVAVLQCSLGDPFEWLKLG